MNTYTRNLPTRSMYQTKLNKTSAFTKVYIGINKIFISNDPATVLLPLKKKIINTIPEFFQELLIQQDGQFIDFIDSPSERLQYLAVKQDFSYIQFINDPTPTIRRFVLKREPSYIKYFITPTETDTFFAHKELKVGE